MTSHATWFLVREFLMPSNTDLRQCITFGLSIFLRLLITKLGARNNTVSRVFYSMKMDAKLERGWISWFVAALLLLASGKPQGTVFHAWPSGPKQFGIGRLIERTRSHVVETGKIVHFPFSITWNDDVGMMSTCEKVNTIELQYGSFMHNTVAMLIPVLSGIVLRVPVLRN